MTAFAFLMRCKHRIYLLDRTTEFCMKIVEFETEFMEYDLFEVKNILEEKDFHGVHCLTLESLR
jgi:hypothetical protein